MNSAKIRQRVQGLSLVERGLELSLGEVISSYSGKFFSQSSVSKSEFFHQCLDFNLSPESKTFILERCQLAFHKDARSTIEYGLELVYGWLSEDLVLQALKNLGCEVELFGSDKNREFLNESNISTNSDFRMQLGSKSKKLEVVFSWNGTWAKTDTWDLRESKFRRLTSNAGESLCLGIELPKLNGFIFEMNNVKGNFVRRNNPAWGNKTVYSLLDMRSHLKPLNEILVEVTKLL